MCQGLGREFTRTLRGARLQTGYSPVSGLSLAELAQKGESWGGTTAKAPPISRIKSTRQDVSQWECQQIAGSPPPPSYKKRWQVVGETGDPDV